MATVKSINTYRVKYKCRYCGEIFDGGGCGGEEAIRKDYYQICFNIPSGDIMASSKLYHHDCANGNIGIADIIGYEKEDD